MRIIHTDDNPACPISPDPPCGALRSSELRMFAASLGDDDHYVMDWDAQAGVKPSVCSAVRSVGSVA
jgi:hypothetical protein